MTSQLTMKDCIVKVEDFDIRNHSYGKFSDLQFTPFVRYASEFYRFPSMTKGSTFQFQTGNIIVTNYGFPSPLKPGEDPKLKFSSFQMPFDMEQESCRNFYKMASDLDKKHIENAPKLLGEFIDNYNENAKKKRGKKISLANFAYKSIVGRPKNAVVENPEDQQIEQDEHNVKDDNPSEKQDEFPTYPDYFYVKLAKKFVTKKEPETGAEISEEEIATLFFLKRDDGSVEQIPVKTITDYGLKIQPIFKWRCVVKLLISSNLTASKSPKNDLFPWGPKLKVKQIRFELSKDSIVKNIQEKINTTYALADSDEETETSETSVTVDKVSKIQPVKQIHNPILLSDDEGEEENNVSTSIAAPTELEDDEE